MAVLTQIKHKIFSKKLSRARVYLFFSILFFVIIGTLVAIVTVGTIKKNNTQAKAEEMVKPSYDPVALGQMFMAGLDTSLLLEVSYDPKTQTADVVSTESTFGDVALPNTDAPANEGEFYSYKMKIKDGNKKVLKDSWINYRKADFQPDKNTGRVKLYIVAPDEADLQLEFTDRNGKKLIDKQFRDLPARKHGSRTGK